MTCNTSSSSSNILSSARSRHSILSLVNDLECSREWMGLTCDINNLERMKSRARIRQHLLSTENIATVSCRGHLTNRHSVSEANEPSLVTVQFTTNNRSSLVKPSIYHQVEGKNSTSLTNHPTEFEKNYFTNSTINEVDKLNIKLNTNPNESVNNLSTQYYHNSILYDIDKSDILFSPGSDEFRGSRERLHEIFQHNRLLRRRFFAEIPITDAKDHMDKGTCGGGEIEMIKSHVDIEVVKLGFGSTETLTSQSNQSGSSTSSCNKKINSPIEYVNYRDNDNDDEKYFASIVTIDDTDNIVSLKKYQHKSTADNVNNEIHERDDKMMKNTSDISPSPCIIDNDDVDDDVNDDNDKANCVNLMILKNVRNNDDDDDDDDDNDNEVEYSLTSSSSNKMSLLLELPTKSKTLSEFERKINSPYTTPNCTNNNKSCSDLTIVEDLRSPQLVNNFSNSMLDVNVHEMSLCDRVERSLNDEDCGKSIASSTPGTGSTLPSVYGPMPYKSPRRYVEGEVTIHYRSPVRTEAKEILSEEELARRSAENMRRVYQEERRRKYLQELHDIDSRRHTDNFIPSQKSPIPLNRYDDFLDDMSYRSRSQEQTPEPRLVARALYNFVGQTSRELSFRRGDIILIRRQIDKNWYEGEHNAMVGLFPLNYVEILPYDGARATPKKPYEGQARAKFNFIAQTNLELSLAKGELVVLTRRVDDNWFEGRIGGKKGIFPVTYVEVILEPGQHRPETPVSSKPVASPAAHSMLSNGTASGKMSMGPHHYTPSLPIKTNSAEPQYISLPRIGVTERNKLHVAPVNETLHIDTHSDTVPYRALYNYRPQNEDELELKEGDTVYVMEKCDDGWFVGSSQRTGYFGTFPGNYVERL